jgi:hypothetical protein
MMRRGIFALCVLSLVPQLLFATIIRVPYDYFKIQEGIDAAVNGDTVWVDLGTYFEGINFKGKNILVTSNYIFDRNRHTIENTVIDGFYLSGYDTASVVRFISGESQDAILTGLTIQNGSGTYIDGSFRHGAGILCIDSSPRIESNHIKDNNTCYDVWDSGKGGGIAVLGSSFAQIEGNRIHNNLGGCYYYGYGGGIYFDGDSCILKDNEILDNCSYGCSFMSTWGYSYGGGVFAVGEKITVIGNSIARNSVVGGGEAIGGGAYLKASTSIILQHSVLDSNECTIAGNGPGELAGAGAQIVAGRTILINHNRVSRNCKSRWSVPRTLTGAGIVIGGGATRVEIDWNTFEGNHGEALFLGCPAPTDSFLVTRNVLYGDSLGICCRNCGPRIENNTLYSTFGYGIKTYLAGGTGLQIRNNIVANAVNGPGIMSEGGYVPVLFYNDVWNNAGGNYQGLEPGLFDIQEDPLFVDPERGDLRLTEESPCIDAGDPDPRYYDPDGSRNDIGAFWLGYTPVQESQVQPLPDEFVLLLNYPNPFNAATTIIYELSNPAPTEVTLQVYNVGGQLVTTLVDEPQNRGRYEVIWDGRREDGTVVSSGVYFSTLRIGQASTSRKMVLLK